MIRAMPGTTAGMPKKPVPSTDELARMLWLAVAPGSYLAISHIGTDFFPDKAALAEAVDVSRLAYSHRTLTYLGADRDLASPPALGEHITGS